MTGLAFTENQIPISVLTPTEKKNKKTMTYRHIESKQLLRLFLYIPVTLERTILPLFQMTVQTRNMLTLVPT